MQPFIVATEISKHYGETVALDKVSFEVYQNEIVGFIGPDGAGKSTLFEIMTTLLIPDEGEATIKGMSIHKDYHKIRSQIGFMPGRFSLYQDLSVQENLKFYANIFGSSIEENYHLIKSIYDLLQPFAKRKAGALSGGMKQKLALCCALIHKPLVLFLDEPTTGVDAVSR
jgi:ABC-2 type transport system ATP-binding protein